ncbi:hypothetical protein BU24DRAFT_386855 [Aaosphaeria arxii CBS 175.79]|uniref:Myb-like domain-containing protein n=1 Tax=Aaosphaeria arxii CBS 175.79 TaxID=1450172 RepID=A0A6A5Y3C4_9PLEO|nr:uncharacterized protein BU24DRAFT_386855 [Aaosphaeria arxii CBS 175.79]KAF2019756.1 hypothetical protein BU24DRAFT_386855 [Aaosphaeria arxii CBS 175.79]
MAERRGVRSSSRRITPTPQVQDVAPSQQSARLSRKRTTRSASREIESAVPAVKPTRRSARQASVASDSGLDDQSTRITKKKGRKEQVSELTIVEEVETPIVLDRTLQTPPRPQIDVLELHRSPGGLSQMSGTTAITSMSVTEAEMLEPRFIVRHLPNLYAVSTTFLHHLAPKDGRIEDDDHNILEMQKPDSDFIQDYRDFDADLELRLSRYCAEERQDGTTRYINVRAVERAIVGPDRQPESVEPGIDIVLYLANLAIFAKQMIGTDRSQERIWEDLRPLDKYLFPSLFMKSLTSASRNGDKNHGESGLAKETFTLGLELRTQLAILVMERASRNSKFNPDEELDEVFLASEGGPGLLIRGWDVVGLSEEDSGLPQEYKDLVLTQMKKIRQYFPTDAQSLERGELVNQEYLSAAFPWRSTILQLLHWVRLRHKELQEDVESLGGITSIVEKVRLEMERPRTLEEQPVVKPRKSRTSFGRGRRRSNRRFNPDDPANDAGVDALLDREKRRTVQEREQVQTLQPEPQFEQPIEPDQDDGSNGTLEDIVQQNLEDDYQPILREEAEDHPDEAVIVPEAMPSGPPSSSAAWADMFQNGKRSANKENPKRFIDRQANAREVEFGTGFNDTPPPPEPSEKGKQKQAEAILPRKRRMPFEDSSNEDDASERIERSVEDDDEDDDDDAFQADDRTARVRERREQAPVKKRVRLDPNSSAPTSHQPQTQRRERDASPARVEAPPVSATARASESPPPSTFQGLQQLSQLNQLARATGRRKGAQTRTEWTAEAEQALMDYMREMPQQYSRILKEDARELGLLQDRTQVNLKDKVRNMARTMIRSGTGLQPGFENVITPESKFGRELLEEGYTW